MNNFDLRIRLGCNIHLDGDVTGKTDGIFLQALVAKRPDAGLLLDRMGVAAHRLMELQVGSLAGAACPDKDIERLAQLAGIAIATRRPRAGTVELQIPKLRKGRYLPAFLSTTAVRRGAECGRVGGLNPCSGVRGSTKCAGVGLRGMASCSDRLKRGPTTLTFLQRFVGQARFLT